MSDGSHSEPCINWPCAKGAGHAGTCGTSRDELSSTPTPGPWVVDRLSGSGRLQVNAPSSHTVAIICHNVYIPEEVHAANARLIAAASDLIAALKEALPVLEFEAEARGDSDHLYEIPVRPILRVVLAAIAKAEGRSDG